MDWTIRPPAPADAESLATLHVAVWRHAYRGLIEQPLLDQLDVARSTQRWETTIARLRSGDLGHTVLAAYVDDQPVGIVEVGPATDERPPQPVEIRSLNVAPRWHGRGVAQDLMAQAVGDADAYLWVLRGNERAIGFYRKLGFALDGTERYDDTWRCYDQRMQRPGQSAG
ncbi:N-acetyltransferase family protein [Flexivirga sp. B27]